MEKIGPITVIVVKLKPPINKGREKEDQMSRQSIIEKSIKFNNLFFVNFFLTSKIKKKFYGKQLYFSFLIKARHHIYCSFNGFIAINV